jgi:hypothetical protein
MDTWVLVLAFGMPAFVFLLALRALVVRLRLRSRGALTAARIMEVRAASGDMGEAKELLTYRFFATGKEYTGSTQLVAGCRPRAVGDTIEVLYRIDRPWSSQPHAGRTTDSVALNVIVMICMVATVLFFLWLLSIPH